MPWVHLLLVGIFGSDIGEHIMTRVSVDGNARTTQRFVKVITEGYSDSWM